MVLAGGLCRNPLHLPGSLDRLRESDDFVFSRGQAATYVWIEEADPGMFAEIQRYAREGRWQIINGWWEQPDCNVPAGRVLCPSCPLRQTLLQREARSNVTVGWNPDTFGHNGGLPQIPPEAASRPTASSVQAATRRSSPVPISGGPARTEAACWVFGRRSDATGRAEAAWRRRSARAPEAARELGLDRIHRLLRRRQPRRRADEGEYRQYPRAA